MKYDFLAEAKLRREEFLDDLKGYIKIPSLLDESSIAEGAPFGGALSDMLTHALNLAERDGFKTQNIDGYAGVIEFGEGEEIVGVLGHLDVVPVGEGWTSNPFDMIEKDGYVIGRGITDNKGPTVASYYAIKILRDLNIDMNKKIHLILGCDEESGMRCMKYYRENAVVPDFGFVPDASFPVIYGEKGIVRVKYTLRYPSVIKKMMAGERSNIVLGRATAIIDGSEEALAFEQYLSKHNLQGNLEVNEEGVSYQIIGEFAHAATPEKGVNAAWHILNFVQETYGDELCKKLTYLLADYFGKNVGNAIDGVHMGKLTMNLGILNFSENHCDFVLDIRYPNDTSGKQVLTNIQNALKEQELQFEEEILADKNPLFIDPENELIKTLEKCYREYSNDYDTPLKTMGGGTYARTLDNFAAFGAAFPTHMKPDFAGDAHQADEGVAIDDLITACAIYADALYRLTR